MSDDDDDGPTKRTQPNVLVTGTPGTGKTTLASLISERTGIVHVNVGELVKQKNCYDGVDEELDSNILDEDKLLDVMEAIFQNAAEEGKGIIADFHASELFPECWFDLVLCLRTSTDVLFDRLTARGYNEKKRSGWWKFFFKSPYLYSFYFDQSKRCRRILCL